MTLNNKFRFYAQYFFLFFFVFLLFPAFLYRLPDEGLDASWNIAIHLAYKYNLEFGKDFVFTYGPLGILHSRLPISVNLFVYLFFDLYFLTTLFFVCKEIFKRYFHYGTVIFIFLVITIAMYGALIEWYFFFFLFYLFSFVKTPDRRSHLLQAALLSLICFYFKISLGIIAVIVFLVAITYIFIRRKWKARSYVFLLGLYILFNLLTAQLLHVNLPGYLITGFQLINGYNDSMFRALSRQYVIYLYAALFIISILFCRITYQLVASIKKKEVFKNADELFIYGILGLSVFILFKTGFVRSDGHIYNFYKGVSLLAGFLFLYSPQNFQKKLSLYCCWAVILISSWAVNAMPGSYKPFLRVIKLSFFRIKSGEIKEYVRGISSYNHTLHTPPAKQSQNNDLKNLVGNNTVDIIPSEISKIYFNDLKYDPRPVIQSYTAYNKYLDDLNYQKYMSADAPEFILLQLNSIDERFPFFDESKTKLAILNRYKLAGEINGDLILRKRSSVKELVKTKEDEIVRVKSGEEIPIRKTGDLQYSRIFICYNFWGAIQRLFYKPPALKIILTVENGGIESYRAIKPILEDGIIVNKFIDTEEEFQLLMLSDGLLNKNIKSIRIEPYSSQGGLISDIKMVNSYFAFPEKSVAERIADNLAIEKTFDQDINKYKPILLNPSELEKDSILYGLNYFRPYSQLIKVEGWAFRVKANNENFIVKAILRSEDKIYELSTEKRSRPDLPPYFNRKDVANAGFTATVSKSNLPPADYQLGVMITDTVNNRKWIRYTDQHTLIRSNYIIEETGSINQAAINKKNIQFAFEPLTEDEEKIIIKGWAFVKGRDSKGGKTNLILQNKGLNYRINTDMVLRQDVIDYFKNPLFGYTGFYVEIPKSKLSKGLYSIAVEKIYPETRDSSIAFSDEKIRIDFPEIIVPVSMKELPASEDFLSGIDYVKDSEQFVSISGWAIQNMNEVQNSIIEIVLKGNQSMYACDTELKLRHDVTEYFKSKLNLDDCGFFVKISKKELPKGKYQVGIHIYQRGHKGVVKFIDEFINK